MSKTRIAIAGLTLACLLTTLPALAQKPGDGETIVGLPKLPSAEAQSILDTMLYSYHVFELDVPAIERQVRENGALRIHLGNQTLELELALNDLRDPAYRAVVMVGGKPVEQERTPAATWAGRVAGEADSLVRLTALPDYFVGYVKTEREWLFIDPLSDYARGAGASDFVVYREVDVRPDATKACGAQHFKSLAQELGLPPVDGGSIIEAPRRVDVATEADGQYYAAYGNPGLFNRINSILNSVDGIYQSQLNLTLNVTYQQAWPNASTDPYTSLNATTTLNQFRSWWNSNNGSVNRDIAHQFSAKNFSGSTVGIAWVGVVCNAPSYAYGLSEDQSSSFLRTQLTAHEIGHNFSAGHDNQSPVCPGVNCNGSGPLMCSFLQSSGSNTFSSCSVSSVASHTASNGSCLN